MLALVIVGQDRQLAQALQRVAHRHARSSKGEASVRLTLLAAALSDALNTTHVTIEEQDAHRLIEQATGGTRRRKKADA